MRIIGIDPGVEGAFALLEDNELCNVWDIPTYGDGAKRRLNVHYFACLIRNQNAHWAFIERAQAMPGQGSSSGFLYGRVTGALEAAVMLCALPLELVEASKWKKHFGLKGGDKEASRLKALMLFPQAGEMLARKKDHQRAEAALIALYGSIGRGFTS